MKRRSRTYSDSRIVSPSSSPTQCPSGLWSASRYSRARSSVFSASGTGEPAPPVEDLWRPAVAPGVLGAIRFIGRPLVGDDFDENLPVLAGAVEFGKGDVLPATR